MRDYYDLLMLWIVLHSGRPACLIDIPKRELNNPKSKRVKEIFNFIQTHRLYVQIETKEDVEKVHQLTWSKRSHVNLLVSKKPIPHDFGDVHLRKVLAFRHGKSDYRSDRRASLFPMIDAYDPQTKKTIELWSYNGEPKPATRTHAQALLRKWKTLLKIHPFPWISDLQLFLSFNQRDGYLDRVNKIDDTEYFLNHYNAYIADLENEVEELPMSVLEHFSRKPESQEEIKQRKSTWLKYMKKYM